MVGVRAWIATPKANPTIDHLHQLCSKLHSSEGRATSSSKMTKLPLDCFWSTIEEETTGCVTHTFAFLHRPMSRAPHFICSQFHVTSPNFTFRSTDLGVISNHNKALCWCIYLPLIFEIPCRLNVSFCFPSPRCPATIPLHLPKYNIMETWAGPGWQEMREEHDMVPCNYLNI